MRFDIRIVPCLLALGSALTGPPAARAGAPDPAFPVSAPSVESVIEENTYFYRVMAYEPPVEVRPVRREDAAYDTPEASAIAGISAMLAADLAWFRDTWTESSRQLMEASDRKAGRPASYWPDLWRQRLSGKRVHLTHRIETGRFVLIAYRVSPASGAGDDPASTFDLITVLVPEGDQWKATQELSQDPVLHYWNQPGYRVKKQARGIE